MDQKLYRTTFTLDVIVEHWEAVTPQNVISMVQGLLNVPAVRKVEQVGIETTVEIKCKS
jgi:hypothetical protein